MAAAAVKRGWTQAFAWFAGDLRQFFGARGIKQTLRSRAALTAAQKREALVLIRHLVTLGRRTAILQQARELLHHWHIIHRPFAMVMLVIMTVHIVVAILFGYTWLL